LKILGKIEDREFVNCDTIKISAHCNRVAASDGHMAAVSIKFRKKPSKEEILEVWKNWKPEPQ